MLLPGESISLQVSLRVPRPGRLNTFRLLIGDPRDKAKSVWSKQHFSVSQPLGSAIAYCARHAQKYRVLVQKLPARTDAQVQVRYEESAQGQPQQNVRDGRTAAGC